jgi:ribosomal protein S18 acetylase RimI-like enzyme
MNHAETHATDQTAHPGVRIRAATPADAHAIAIVHVASWRTTYAGIVPDAVLRQLSVAQRARYWQRVLANVQPPQQVFVAVDNERVAGFAAAGRERAGDPLYKGEILAIYLLQSHQRQGIGRRLVGAAAAHLLAEGLDTLLIWVLEANPARRFYAALGGHPVREQMIRIGGVDLLEIGYGWQDMRPLLAWVGAS